MSDGLLVNITLCFVFCFLLMWAAWLAALKLKFFTLVDAVWALGFTPIVWAYALCLTPVTPKKMLIASCLTLWSLRLGLYLAKRMIDHFPREDSRYQTLRESWKAALKTKFFLFFNAQALVLAVFIIPFIFVLSDPNPDFTTASITGLILFPLAVLGEAISDKQASQFRKAHPGEICEVGLWKYSRHPNYFFESLIWVSFGLMAVDSMQFWAVYPPAFMLCLLLFVSGVPYAEAKSLKRKGDEFRQYQNRVSKFIPWFRKKC